ncbi:MAG: hypothetical protein P1V51_08830 [Deltaproteobacteria bacterium]|nr:hypothetical protein [Deltaproteobacteria bacterium]
MRRAILPILLLPLLLSAACLEHSAYEPGGTTSADGGGTDGGGSDGGGSDGGGGDGGGSDGGELCGNGSIDPGERCDQNCPASCNDGNACTFDALIGGGSPCQAACEFTRIEACADGDGCCPAGCDETTDSDCPEYCGNGVINPGETCELGACDQPADCADQSACTLDLLTGNPNACTAQCAYLPVVHCVNGDGCCPAGCTQGTDSDCGGSCGNGERDSGETCDGDCPADCDDGDLSTYDVLAGSASTCSLTCTSIPEFRCETGDGVCPKGCERSTDFDCGAACGDGLLDAGEDCELPYLGYDCPPGTSGPASTCDPATCLIDESPCNPVCGDGIVHQSEDCDPLDFDTACGALPGTTYTGGTASCSASCVLDTSACTTCGDGAVEGDEACDDPGSLGCNLDCTLVTFGGTFPTCEPGHQRIFEHALVVAAAGSTTEQTLVLSGAPGVIAFDALDRTSSMGRAVLDASGALRFLPGPVAGITQLGFTYQTASGTQDGCVVIMVVDPTSAKVIGGGSWEDAQNWSGGSLPGSSDVALVDATAPVDVTSPMTVGGLQVTNESTLSLPATLTSALTPLNSVQAGGRIYGHLTPQGAVTLAGWLPAVSCAASLSLQAPTIVDSLIDYPASSCQLDLGSWRLTVLGDLSLPAGSILVMNVSGSILEVRGNLTLQSGIVGNLSSGELWILGDATLGLAASDFSGGHKTIVRSDSSQSLAASYLGNARFDGAGQLTLATALSVAGTLTLGRPLNPSGGVVSAQSLILESGFFTTETANFQANSCTEVGSPTTTCQDLGFP